MLQTSRTDNWVNRGNRPPESRLSAELMAEAVAFIRRRFSIIALTCSIVFGIALLYLITAVPTFTANAELLIASKAGAVDAASVSTIVESQISIIRSEDIAREVVRKLDLAKDPEFSGQGIYTAWPAPLSVCSAGADQRPNIAGCATPWTSSSANFR